MKIEVHMGKSRSRSPLRRQSGAVLVVSLVMLLLLTIIGMSAVDMTTLDTRISANTKDKALAFDAAEAALNTAGNSLIPGNPLPVSNTPGFFGPAVMADNWWQTTDETWWSNNGQLIAGYAGRTNASSGAVYVIDQTAELIGGGANQQVTDLTMGKPKPVTRFYRITARGEGPGGTEVHVQSIYARKVYLNVGQ